MPTLGNSASIQVRAVREVTPGTLPAGAMTVIPFGTMPFKSSFTRGTEDDVNSHGQAEDNPVEDLQVSANGSGDFRYARRDLSREEVFRNTLTPAVSVSSALIAAVASGNKLTRALGWGTLAAGEFIWVNGFAGGGGNNAAAFLAKIASTYAGSGTDLPLEFPILVNESAGPTVTVSHLGQLTFGTSLLTSAWEEFNLLTSKGRSLFGISANQWDISVDHPSHWKESFTFVGMQKAARLSAQLANTTTAATLRKIFNSNTNTGDSTVTGSQMGLRYGGTLLTDAILKSLKLSVTSPKLTEGGTGTLGPQAISIDGTVTVKLDLKFLRSGSDVDTLMDDALDPNAEKSFGLGLRDGDGHRVYLWLPKVQPYNGDPDGVKRQGSEQVDLSYTARYDGGADTSMRYAMLT
jgi:hypothetical protein